MNDDNGPALTLEDGHEASRRIMEYERRMAYYNSTRAREPGDGKLLTFLLTCSALVLIAHFIGQPLDPSWGWPLAIATGLLGVMNSFGQLFRITEEDRYGGGLAFWLSFAATALAATYMWTV